MIPDDIADAPASAKLIYVVLAETEETFTAEELAQRTRLPRSTAYDALAALERRDAIARHPSCTDGRQAYYTVPYDP